MTLTHEEQSALVAQAKTGDRLAQETLLRFCERDIQGMLRKAKCSAADKEDLAQTARLVVWKAIQTFNPTAGKQFRFYAAEWAREDMRRMANKLSTMVVRNVHTRGCDVHLDAPVSRGEGDESETYMDTMSDSSTSPEDTAVECDEAERLRCVLESVIEQMKVQVSTKYDRSGLTRNLVYDRLLAHDPVKLDSLSERFGVSRETVRKLENVILGKVHAVLQGA